MAGGFRNLLKAEPALVPLFAIIGAGLVGAGVYLGRLATRNPDVSWDRKSNPHPWQNIKPNENIKLYGTEDLKQTLNTASKPTY